MRLGLETAAAAHLEEMLGIKQAGVNLGWRLVAEANHKDLSGGISGCCRLGGDDFVKELVQGVQECIVILRPAHRTSSSDLKAINIWCACRNHQF